MKKLRCKKDLGIYYYEKIMNTSNNDLDAPIYELYNEKKEWINNFAYYDDMIYFIETGVII